MCNQLQARIYFRHNNEQLEKQIRQGKYPFLGLYASALTANHKQYIQNCLRQMNNPIEAYLNYLNTKPALFSIYLTAAVLHGYGKNGQVAVWQHLEAAISPDYQLSAVRREQLWKAYRKACITLGLPVLSRLSGNNYMINEFLHQAGVPLAYVERLTQKMLRHTQAVGLPEDDDPTAIQLWRSGLISRLNAPIPQAVRNAIAEDDTGFYARLFVQFYHAPDADAQTPLEQALSQALQQRSKENAKSFSSPSIVWRDDLLGVELPAGEGVEWQVCVGQQCFEHNGLNEPRLVPLLDCLVSEILISRDNKQQSYPIWTSLQNNALLLFDRQGAFVTGTDFSQKNLDLSPDQYTVISRFEPDTEDALCIDDEHELYQWSIDLAPGAVFTLRRGPAQLQLKADSKPVLSWQGESYKPARGAVFFAAKGLQLQVQVPSEWLQEDTQLVLHLTATTLGDTQVITLNFQDSPSVLLELESYCQHWQAGFTRLLAELRRQDSSRALARTAIYLWNGLQSIQQGQFSYTVPPRNLDNEQCDNIQQHTSAISFKEAYNRFFRLTFKLSDNRSLKLTCAVPGIFLYLETETVQGWQEKPLRKGSTLAVGSQRRDMLRIYSSESGVLSLGTLHKTLDARRNSAMRLPLSSLDTYLTPQQHTLEFRAENQQFSEPLLKLITPQEVMAFKAQYEAACYRIVFSLHEEIEKLTLNAINLLDGEQQTCELDINDVSRLQQQQPYAAWLSTQTDEQHVQHHLACLLETWSSGAWLLNIQIKHQGRWKSLSNARQDTFAAVFLLREAGRVGRTDEIAQQIMPLDANQQLCIFQRIHQALLPCYAPEAWDQGIKDLLLLWHRLINQLDPNQGHLVTPLAMLAAERPPDTSPDSWIPLRGVAAWLPMIYAQVSRDYRSLHQHAALLPRCLGLLSHFPQGLTALFQDGVFDPIAAAGFGNFVQMQTQGAEPVGFQLNHYRTALEVQQVSERLRLLNQEDWQPSGGHYLGALHYLYATQQLHEAYRQTLGGHDADDPTGNHWRRGQALHLAQQLRRYNIQDFVQAVPAHWVMNGVPDSLGLLHHISTTQDEQEQENLEDFIHALSLLAQVCRWETRQAGALEKFTKTCDALLENQANTTRLAWTYLFFIGEAVFGFYLLLWEMAIMAEN